MMNESKAMKEIHGIRLQIYEMTKNMTPEEQTEFTRREAQATIEKHGLKIARPDSPPCQKSNDTTII